MITRSIQSFGVLILFCMFASCTQKKHEFPLGCELENLLLAITDLPAGSEFSSSGQPLPESTTNSVGSTFYLSSHLIDHSIFWYSAEKYSSRKFKEEVSAAGLINVDNQSTQTKVITKSLLADSYEVVCGDDVLAFRCIYVGRYKNYVTVLNAEITEDAVSFTTYNELIEIVDKKISSCK